MFRAVIFMIHSILWQFPLFDFDKFRDTAPLISFILDTLLTFLTPRKEEYFIRVEIRQ